MHGSTLLSDMRKWLAKEQAEHTVKITRSKETKLVVLAAIRHGRTVPHPDRLSERAAALELRTVALHNLHLLLTDSSCTEADKLYRLPPLLESITALMLQDPDYPVHRKSKLIDALQTAVRQRLDLLRKARLISASP